MLTVFPGEAPILNEPAGVGGQTRAAKDIDTEAAAAFMTAFVREAFGTEPDGKDMRRAAEQAVADSSLLLWTVGDEPVCMANWGIVRPDMCG